MFQRVFYEDWQLVFPIVALIAALAFFSIMSWRALHMKRSQIDRFARMPLDQENSKAA